MKQLFAIQTNDPSLLRCQLRRLRETLSLPPEEAIGVGFYLDDDLLLTKAPPKAEPHDLEAMLPQLRSPSLIAVSGATDGAFDAEAIDPFRFRRWVFAMVGGVEGFDSIRPALVEELPPFIARQIRSATDREHLFALFLHELHLLGRIDDPSLSAEEAARCLRLAIRRLDALARERGQVRQTELAAVASNGRALAAARRGLPLFYGLLEGMASCEVCDLPADGSGNDPGGPLAQLHRRSKSVAIVAEPASREGYIEVPDGSTLAVGRWLEITLSPIQGVEEA